MAQAQSRQTSRQLLIQLNPNKPAAEVLLARTTPLTRQRKTLPSFDQTFKKLTENLEAFDVSKVRYEDVQRAAVVAPPAAG